MTGALAEARLIDIAAALLYRMNHVDGAEDLSDHDRHTIDVGRSIRATRVHAGFLADTRTASADDLLRCITAAAHDPAVELREAGGGDVGALPRELAPVPCGQSGYHLARFQHHLRACRASDRGGNALVTAMAQAGPAGVPR
ncbi:hypothetical protein J2S43_001064 [Catenuloplanes nepalensis]|uniref:HNH endonuclease n=1 Tax=Catenuloplanes nepalensis TaxID=587533 RepID=A0ABT9MMA8_9ACTN|nr:hypothetical protein [Catenuloplanes nepalensis]MDP9792552.1 hypothetical protein [Catenuloplanes nepalensis]